MTLRALVVGDRFLPAALFVDALGQAADTHGLDMDIVPMALPYPAADRLPLPESALGTEFRPLWEDPTEMIRRAAEDLAADPTITEYTGAVDLLARHLAPLVAGFGMHLLVHDPYVFDADLAGANARRASLDELLSVADVVLTAARLTDETRGMIGTRELALLQPDGLFVNTARSEIVDVEALRAAVARGQRVIVDVFSPEPPLRNDPLVTAPGALLSPHIAGASREAAARGAHGVARAVCAHLARAHV
ncbi:MAG: hypothetical protein LC797_14565 [Chloroflexi bacterium]|nr:hypothetical protein [Chloroflexota bacterium]